MGFLSKILGDANEKYISSLKPLVDEINKLEPKFGSFSLEELKAESGKLKKLLSEEKTLDDILPEAFALAREASKRTLSKRHYDVQLMGGIGLHRGNIVEMRTGEGKTLAATLPAYLNALSGKGVHVITVNDHLARRDTVWMGQIYDTLGLTVACINHDASYIYDPAHISPQKQEDADKERDETGSFRVIHEFLRPITRREAYEADITYGTNNEFGFDYLRDNMSYDISQVSQAKGHNFAIIDEVDSILIDEARTPLIISAPDTDSTKLYETFSKIVPRLIENEDYNVDEKLKAATLTEQGIEKVEKTLNIKNIYEEGGTRYVHHLEEALKARVLFQRDKDYVVKDGEVIIVDEFTGRLMPGRRWSGGLHQAVEAKEGVGVNKESRTMATITFQNYFRFYKKLSGMTGTAQTSAEEFDKVYKIDVITIPTHREMIREDLSDKIFKTEAGKIKSVINEIAQRHAQGQPVLVGTVSIEKNEILSAMLKREGIPHQVLNAKNHEKEAEIIAQAGKYGAVTVATNMAGRGIDIMLGGVPPSKSQTDTEYEEWERNNQKVKDLGGLHVIGTERHDARRIDNQLRGRAGRQGDPGSSQFFISTEDELVRIFGGDRLKNVLETLGVPDDEPIENRLISRAIEQAQNKIEGHNFDMRKYVLEYDDVMNRHRETIYGLRRKTLELNNVEEAISGFIYGEIDKLAEFHASSDSGEWGIEEINESIKAMIPIEEDVRPKIEEISKTYNIEQLKEFLYGLADTAYEQREKQLGKEAMHHLEKLVLLRVIDELWVDHLETMEHLRDSVRLRAYGQRDPLIEYKVEGQRLFNELQSAIGSQVTNLIFKVSLVQAPIQKQMEEGRAKEITNDKSQITNQTQNPNDKKFTNSSLVIRNSDFSSDKIGRNDPCPCGAINPATGQVYKWKKCGMINAPHHKR
ncbi:MAG: preprotein translocase subunit SecA [bacterium]|nr:preprotein translocase subunit SecA [bacterium]